MTVVSLIIPYRDRGTDSLRSANLTRVLDWWSSFGVPINVVSDGREGTAQFCRHAAYNRGAAQTDADILVYLECDMLLPFHQLDEAIALAKAMPRLVVPFTERHELSPDSSELVREHKIHPRDGRADVVKPKPRRVGAINVISRQALELVGRWDEKHEGNWWDDRSMHIAFDMCTNPTEWVDGPSWHLWHLPGHAGSHLTREDKAATAANRRRWDLYRKARSADEIRELTMGQR